MVSGLPKRECRIDFKTDETYAEFAIGRKYAGEEVREQNLAAILLVSNIFLLEICMMVQVR
jgi:hypothetical protein